MSVVSELVGHPRRQRADAPLGRRDVRRLGPINRRGMRSMPRALGLLLYSMRLRARRVRPDSWAALGLRRVSDAANCASARRKRWSSTSSHPSLDTTILASTHLLWVLAAEPRRLGSRSARTRRSSRPRSSRTCGWPRRSAGSPAGSRATTRSTASLCPRARASSLLFGGSEPRRRHASPTPSASTCTAPTARHLGWGNGPHTCVGIHLAKLEMRMLLEAMVERVDRISRRRADAAAQQHPPGHRTPPRAFTA